MRIEIRWQYSGSLHVCASQAHMMAEEDDER